MNGYWYPLGAHTHFGRPEVGWLVARRHKVFRVVEVNDIAEVDWTGEQRRDVESYQSERRACATPFAAIIRPVSITGDDPRSRDHDEHISPRRGVSSCRWSVYPTGHYPVCAQCGEPVPCREEEASQEAERTTEWMRRFDMPGVCPGCQEPIAGRQKFRTFEENVIVPLGPPVTFHTRGRCMGALLDYEDEWVKADPDNRRSSRPPECKGWALIHCGTSTYECDAGDRCPGLLTDSVVHRSLMACHCPEHPGGFIDGATRHMRNTGRIPDPIQLPETGTEQPLPGFPGGEAA